MTAASIAMAEDTPAPRTGAELWASLASLWGRYPLRTPPQETRDEPLATPPADDRPAAAG